MRILKTIISKLKPEKIKVNAEVFKKSISTHFVKHLRSEGWKGSGFNFYRNTENDTIEVISSFPDRYGESFYVEVGIHFTQLNLRTLDDLKKITTACLDIRRRLTPNQYPNHSWDYPTTKTGLEKLNKILINTYSQDGKNFFDLFVDWKDSILKLSKEDIGNYEGSIPFPTLSRTARLLALLNYEAGNIVKAKQLAEYGLSSIDPPNGSALIPDFKKVINATNTA